MPTMYSDSIRAFLKPIVPFLDDPEIMEVVVNGPTEVWIERKGRIERVNAQFSEEGLLAACRNIAQFVGRTLSDERPRLDARLPDGSRIHVVLPPVARKGALLAIRKFMREAMTIARLVELGSVSSPLAALLDAAMKARLNVIVAGGTGSGKTSLLNVLSGAIGRQERIVTIEDSAELQLQQEGVIGLESRPPDKFGKGEVTLAELLNSALRLRPDRIVVGEVRGGECFSLLQAMNTGHSGSMATTHANTPVDTLRRLESLCLMSAVELPLVAVRAQVASAVNLVVCMERFPDGTRKVTHVSEVLPLDDRGEYRVQDLFVFATTGRDPKTETVLGHHAPTGVVPLFHSRLKGIGIDLPENFFDPEAHDLAAPEHFIAGLGEQTHWTKAARARRAGEPMPDVPRWTDASTASPQSATPVAAKIEAPAQPVAKVESPAQKPVKRGDPFAPNPLPRVEGARTDPSPARPLRAESLAPKPAPVMKLAGEEPTIQISADLLEEAEGVMEKTAVRRPPVDDRTDPSYRPPGK